MGWQRRFRPRELWKSAFNTQLYEIGLGTWAQMKRAHLLLVASSLAFITILSIIPLLAVSFAIFHAFGGMDKLYATLEPFILRNLAQGSSDQAISILQNLLTNVRAKVVGVGGSVSLILTTMSLLYNVENAINRVWNAPVRRSLVKRVASYWLFITLGPLMLAVALGVAESTDFPVARFWPGGPGGSVMYLFAVSIFFLVYKIVPSTTVNWRFALGSAVVTAFVWNLAGEAYGLYTTRVVSYDKIYGSLGAIPIFLLWVYILWMIVLTGAALTATLQTRGEPKLSVTPGSETETR